MDTIDSLIDRQLQEVNNLYQRRQEAERALTNIIQKYEIAAARLDGLHQAREAYLALEAQRVQPTRKRQRRLTKQWREILMRLSDFEAFSYDDIAEVAQDTGHEITRDTLRSQMSIYRNSGLVEALEDGLFVLTERGRFAAGKLEIPDGEEVEEEDEADF